MANLDGVDELSPYVAPRPESGSHRYVQWLFEQPSRIHFETLSNIDDTGGRLYWNYSSFVGQYKLGRPVASNWQIVMHDPSNDDITRPVAPVARSYRWLWPSVR